MNVGSWRGCRPEARTRPRPACGRRRAVRAARHTPRSTTCSPCLRRVWRWMVSYRGWTAANTPSGTCRSGSGVGWSSHGAREPTSNFAQFSFVAPAPPAVAEDQPAMGSCRRRVRRALDIRGRRTKRESRRRMAPAARCGRASTFVIVVPAVARRLLAACPLRLDVESRRWWRWSRAPHRSRSNRTPCRLVVELFAKCTATARSRRTARVTTAPVTRQRNYRHRSCAPEPPSLTDAPLPPFGGTPAPLPPPRRRR